MTKKKQTSISKHLDFIAFLRSSMLMPEKNSGSVNAVDDNDTENEVDYDLMRELEKKFDELFGPLD